MDNLIAGLKGCAAYLDDVIVTGKTLEEHDGNLLTLFKRIDEFGFCVKVEKCSFSKREVKFLCNAINKDGRKLDPVKIEAIINMPAPANKKQLKSFLGMVTYYSIFIQDIRSLREPLDELETQNEFKWEERHQKCFDNFKKLLQSDLLLTHYNPKEEIIIAVDACEYGIGGVILHRFEDGSEKAIAHAGRALTKSEKNYRQIEKEALALVWAIRKFHRYVYGRHFKLLTDHKPLVSIFGSKKGISSHAANRLQRWELALLAYDFTIEYRNTTKFGLVDALSKVISTKRNSKNLDPIILKIEKEIGFAKQIAIDQLPITKNEIERETRYDEELQTIIKALKTGVWPKSTPHASINNFRSPYKELSIQNGILFMGARAVIPKILQNCVLKMLRDGHPGISKMKMRARKTV